MPWQFLQGQLTYPDLAFQLCIPDVRHLHKGGSLKWQMPALVIGLLPCKKYAV